MKYDLKKEKIVVHCQTLEEAEKVQEKGLELGLCAVTLIKLFKEGRRHFVIKENYIEYGKNKYDWEEEGYQIIPASEYLSQFGCISNEIMEEVPKYGDKVWVRDSEDEEWSELIFAGFIDDQVCVFYSHEQRKLFESRNGSFVLLPYSHYRTTDPGLDKKVLELTLSEIAEKLGVDEVKIKK